jgi:molecular chaperone GrpE
LAEFENYKKRSLRERADLLKYQGDRVFQEFLPIVDNLELALYHSGKGQQSNAGSSDKLFSGVELIHKMFLDLLGKSGVTAIVSLGKDFDPALHSAISKIQSADAKPGTVINELRKGYMYKDKLLRASEVVVAAAPDPQSNEQLVEKDESGTQDS